MSGILHNPRRLQSPVRGVGRIGPRGMSAVGQQDRGHAMPVPVPPVEAGLIPRGADGSSRRSAWWPVLLLGAVVLACWAVPALRGHGPYGRGLLRLLHIYTGIFAALAWLASL